jgi:hypothetical protein
MEKRNKIRIKTLKIANIGFPKCIAISCVVYTKDLQACENEALQNMECNICFENPSKMSYPYVSSCGHGFCLLCILRWLNTKHVQKEKRACPICRGDMKQAYGFSIFRLCIPIKMPNSLVYRRLSIDQLKDLVDQMAARELPT